MDISDVIGIFGLLLLIGIFVLLRKREKKGAQDSKSITGWQGILLTVGGLAAGVVLIVVMIMHLPDIWTWLFSLLFGGGGTAIS